MQIEPVHSSEAPEAIGPYSQGITYGGLLFCSGQISINPATGELPSLTASQQAARCLQNLEAVCRAANTSLRRAVKVTVYLTDLSEFASMNEAFLDALGDHRPARATVGVAALPLGAAVEIDATVALR